MPELTHSLPPLTPAQLEEAEASLGIHLPATYRQFLLQHNGGRLQNWHFCYDAELAPDGFLPEEDSIEIETFFGIGSNGSATEPGNLLEKARACHQALAITGKFLPDNWIWIGQTVHDDELMLAVAGPDAGCLYLLYARDEYFADDFNSFFDAKGRLEYPEDLMISRDIQRFLNSAVQGS